MTRSGFLVVFAGIALSSCQPSGGPMRQEDNWSNLEANMIYERAEDYYAASRYPDALAEYRKFLDAYPELHRADDASFRIAQSLEALGERLEAADAYRALALLYSRSGLAASAHLRAGELYELEGWLKDAEWDYGKASDHRHTKEGKLAAQRLAAIEAIFEEEKRAKKESRQSIWSVEETEAAEREAMASGEPPLADAPKDYKREYPPRGRSLIGILTGR